MGGVITRTENGEMVKLWLWHWHWPASNCDRVFQILDARQSKARTGTYLPIITVYQHATQCNAMQ